MNVLAGLSVVGALAGCTTTPTTVPTHAASYKDGTYTAPGSYYSPGGEEHISVKLTVAHNVVTAVTVTTVQADPTATSFEQMFEAGIGAAVVGKNLNDLDIHVVAGSSLTSQGFDQALATIKAEAKG